MSERNREIERERERVREGWIGVNIYGLCRCFFNFDLQYIMIHGIVQHTPYILGLNSLIAIIACWKLFLLFKELPGTELLYVCQLDKFYFVKTDKCIFGTQYNPPPHRHRYVVMTFVHCSSFNDSQFRRYDAMDSTNL